MNDENLTGVWLLKSFFIKNVRTGEQTEQFGPDPKGTLILHPDGRMVALITPAEQISPKSVSDQSAAFQKLIAYSGRYRLDPPNEFITSVDIAWFQPWVNTEQARTYTLSGDTLDIISAPTRLPRDNGEDDMIIGILSWQRE